MGYVTVEAPDRQGLDSCVRCGLCLPHCPTFRLTGKETASPRGRISAMSAVLAGEAAVDGLFEDVMTFCLGCRACEAVCPSLVPYGRLLEGARAEIAAQRPSTRRALRRQIVGRALGSRGVMRAATFGAMVLQRLRLRSVLPRSMRRSFTGLRPLRSGSSTWWGRTIEPAGPVVGTVGLLAGCVMEPWFPGVHDATVGLLRRAGYRVVVSSDQTCCGALAAHDGAASEARVLAARNVAAFRGVDLVVADAAGCSAHLKGYGHWGGEEGGDLAERARDATEVVASLLEEGRLPRLDLDLGPVAVQDPCHLRHAQRLVDQPRAILEAAGYRPVEIDPDGLCCGAAGIYGLLRPEASAELGTRKAAQVQASGSTIVASANPGCEMQLRAHLPEGYRTVHPIELYWEALAKHPNRVVG